MSMSVYAFLSNSQPVGGVRGFGFRVRFFLRIFTFSEEVLNNLNI